MDCNKNSLDHIIKAVVHSVFLLLVFLPLFASVHAEHDDDDDYDNTPPRTPTVNKLLTEDATPLITGTFDSDDARGGFSVTVNGVRYTLGYGNLTASGDNWHLNIPDSNALGEGVYDVSARAEDRAGNSAYDITYNELTIDMTAPIVTVSSLITSDSTPALSGTIKDPAMTIGSCTASHENANFTNPQLISGSSLSEGAVYRFSDVFPNGPLAPIDALVRIVAFTGGASLNAIDVSSSGLSKAFQPSINSTNNQNQSVLFSITFVTGGGNYGDEVAISFFGTPLDIDGSSRGTREYIEISLPSAYFMSDNTMLNITQLATVVRGEVKTAATAPGASISLDPKWAFSNYFENKSSFNFRIGKVNGNSDRLYSLDMDRANFSNPNSVFITNPETCGNDPDATINVVVDGEPYVATNNGDGTWTLADDTINALRDGTYDVTVTATDAAGNRASDTTTNELTIDTTAPTVTATPITSNDTTPALSGTVNDSTATVRVSINGRTYTATNNGNGTWTLPDNTISPALSDGAYDVTVTATDVAGNSRSDGTSNELTIDTAAPIVTITSLTSSDSTPALSGTVDDPAATIIVMVNGTPYPATNNGDGGWVLPDNTIEELPEGSYDIMVTVTDVAGNSRSETVVNGVVIDTTAPTVTVAALTTNDTTPALNGTINDPNASVTVTINGNTYPANNNGNGTWALPDNTVSPALSDDTYDVTVTAMDVAGNSRSDGTSNELTIDTTAPTATTIPQTSNDATPELNGTIDDPDATVTVTINGNTYSATNNGDGTWTLPDNTIAPALTDGSYDILVTATDAVGNSHSETIDDAVTIDTTAPTVTVAVLETSDTTPALSGAIDDPAAIINVTVNGATYPATNNGDGTWTLADNTVSPLADGTYDVVVSATDGAGNSGSDATNNELTIDSTAPTIIVTSLTTSDTTPALSGTVSDPAATVSITVNGAEYPAVNNGNGTWTLADDSLTALADGSYDVIATAIDANGNTGNDNTSDELTIDTTAPTVTVTQLTTNDTTPALSGIIDDPNANVTVSINGNTYSAINNGDGTWTLPDNTISPALADGSYEVTVTATDAVGNSRNETVANAVTVDSAAPTITVNAQTTSDTTPALGGAVNDPAATITVTVNGNTYPAFNNGNGTWTLPDDTISPALSDGSYDITVTATDAVGNSSSETIADAVTVDSTAPTVAVTPQTSSDSTPALSGTIDDPDATVTVTINGNTYSATNNGDGTWTLPDNTIAPALTDGSYDIIVTATDAVGNSHSETIDDAVTIDSAAPTITVTSQTTSDTTPPLSGTIDDPNATITVSINGNNYSATNNGDGTWTLPDNIITPALVNGSYDVMAVATDAQNNSGSDSTTNELIIDNNAPKVTVMPLIASDTTPALRGTIDDATAIVTVTVNGATYTATNHGDGTWTLPDNTISPLPERSYDVVVLATDSLGNSGSDGTTNELTIDTTAPIVTVTPQTTSDTTPALSGAVDDPKATISVTVDGTPHLAVNNGDGTWTLPDNTLSALLEGTYDVVVTAIDAASNRATDDTTNELIIDSSAPTITVTPQMTSDTTPALSGTIDDPNATVSVTVNGATYSATNNGDGTWTLPDNTITPALADGSYDVLAIATDAQNNSGTDGTTSELTIDSNAPTVTVAPLVGSDTTPALAGTIDDPNATITVTVNGITYPATNNGDGTWTLADNTISVLPEGTYDVIVSATDAQGNQGSDGTTNELTIDATAPVVTVMSQISSDSTPALSGMVDDPNATITVTVNGSDYSATNNGDGTWALADNIITPALVDGSYEVMVTATDAAGNSGSDSSTNELTIDSSAPVVTIAPLITSDTTPGLSGTVSDPAASITVTVNGGSYSAVNNGDGTWTLADNTIAALSDGTYEVVVTATDISGNSGSDGSTNELTIDSNAPGVTISSLTTNDATPALSGTVDDPNATISVTVNGNTYPATNNGDGTWALADNTLAALPDGTYDVIVTVTDAADNIGNDGTSNELTIDATAPTITVITLLTSDSTPVLGGAVDDPNATISVTVNGVIYPAMNNGNGTWILADNTITPPLADGVYDVSVTATDIAGNIGSDSTSNELTVDSSAPAITVLTHTTSDTTPALGGTVNDPAAMISVSVNGVTYPATNLGNGVWTLADNTISPPLANGTYDVIAIAIDSFGNSASDGTNNELTINTALAADRDGDGIPNVDDLDDDNDGISDAAEGDGAVDTDGDGVPDSLDLDSDNDALFDLVESGADASALDLDRNGRIDSSHPVSNNGLADVVETAVDSGIVDYNGDSALDSPLDSDGDSVPDFRDLDSDNDTITDVIEAGDNDSDRNGRIGTSPVAVNEDGLVNGAGLTPIDTDGDGLVDSRDVDADGDGSNDIVEAGGIDSNNDGQIDGFIDSTLPRDGYDDSTPFPALSDLPDSDFDGIPDYRDNDDIDNDGIPDSIDLDDDNDGIPDLAEGMGLIDSDGDSVPDSRDLDSDNDGLFDLVESGADAATLDSNNDGRIDTIFNVGTNGLADQIEVIVDSVVATVDYNGNNIPDTQRNSDGDIVPDFRDLDSDNDSITDVIEGGGSDPDRNGFIGIGNPPVVNPDGVASGAGITPPDTDGDGVPDYRDLDSDNDGIRDLVEAGGIDANGDGRIDSFSDIVDSNGLNDSTVIKDLSDLPNSDADATPDYRDIDSDDDGVTDLVETGGIDNNDDGMIDDFNDSNGDGLDDATAGVVTPLPDGDGDGLPDYRDSDTPGAQVAPPTGPGNTDGRSDTIQTGLNGIGAFDPPLLLMMIFIACLIRRNRRTL